MTVHVITSPVFFLNSLYGIPIEAKMEKKTQDDKTPVWPTTTLGIIHLLRGAELSRPWQTATTAVMWLI